MGGTILVVQHDDDCTPALLGGWLQAAGARLDVRRPYAGDELPPIGEVGQEVDALLVLGGPMGADDDATAPWLTPVKAMIRDAAASRLPTLGLCLGHQLAAVALGGRVEVNPRGQQLGVLDVGWTAEAPDDDLFGALAETPARGLHWNDDVVAELPAGATVLARASTGEVQAARLAPTVWGLQLHPEVDLVAVRPWAAEDEGSHHARGIDQAAVLAELDQARAELDATWQPLAEEFARLAGR